jgi:hypothetical protein
MSEEEGKRSRIVRRSTRVRRPPARYEPDEVIVDDDDSIPEDELHVALVDENFSDEEDEDEYTVKRARKEKYVKDGFVVDDDDEVEYEEGEDEEEDEEEVS